MNSIYATVKILADERGMSVLGLADKLGINRKTLYSALNGNPRLSNLQRIADGLHVRLSDIIAIAEDIDDAAGEYSA